MAENNSTIPKGWKKTTLGEVAEKIFSGGTPDTRISKYWDGALNWLSSGETGKKFIFDTKKKITKEGAKESSTRLADENYVVIATAGQGNTRGQVSLLKIKSYINQSVIAIDSKKNESDNFWLFYNLSSRYSELRFISESNSIRGSLTTKILGNLKILLPTLPEQKAIAAVLSSFDNKIELLREENKTLESIAQTIFKEWFVKFNFPDENGKPYKDNGGKTVASELGTIPEGWRVGKIKNLINILPGFAFSSTSFSIEGKYKLVTIKNVQDNYFNPETKDKLQVIPEKMPGYCNLSSGDILLSLTGNIGRICLVNGEGFLLNQRVAKIQAKNEIDYAFAYLLFLQNSIFSLLQSTASGTAQQNLSPVQTRELYIFIAERNILDQFGSIANKLIQKINNNNSQIQTLSTLRDTLLPKLMRGEIRVQGFDN
ncbi:MAG: restriction endonuclease subunit S [Candidatus Ratteibacteria bacterium]